MIDAKMPFLAAALDCDQVQTQLRPIRPDIQRVMAALLVRHKPGRRALIEYRLATPTGPLTLLGKIRAKGTHWASYRLQQALWQQGFDAASADGYSVPAVVGCLPVWQMWLQQKVSGIPATEVLPTAAGVALAQRIAALAHKLHRCAVIPEKTHTLADELRILHQRLLPLAQAHPHWQSRLAWVLESCDALAASFPAGAGQTSIHRDFYSDQILVDGDRLWLVDLDLACQGHPSLDIGNFIAHLSEQSLRQFGHAAALSQQEKALQTAFVEVCCAAETGTAVAGLAERLHAEIEIYSLLSLVRHIAISQRLPARRAYSEAILQLCEARLQLLSL
ncbi:MAG: phosphotransferase [Almyronema sp.]